MAWIRERRRGDGGITYYVTWREPGATEESTLTIRDDRAAAELNVRLLEANGNSYSAAQKVQEHARIGGPSVKGHMIRHTQLLTRAGPDQLKRYESAINNHFSSTLGKMPLAVVRQEDVIHWIRYMQNKLYAGKPLSAKTIANHHGLLSAAMKRAHDTGLIALNPCAGVQLPEDDRTEEVMRFMTASESLAVTLAQPERYRPLMAFLRATGARFGEATALVGGDFQLDIPQPVVRIEKAWKRDSNNRFYVGKPKTKKSRRTISLPPSLVNYIRAIVESAERKGLVFVTGYGGPIRHSTYYEFWSKSLDHLGYSADERPRIHDMRHTHASIMLAAGMDMYELSRRLGHESVTTTVDRYSHLLPDAQFRSATIAENALGGFPDLPESTPPAIDA
ncbi:tyrosine-type recombinase/integrase [Arthrobacter roseus]|uniref:tyrosine-type recombinase/integrase n=1 Tax=Arthrobacter roseus TaxID=136274 RepID=UPI001966C38D|nr:site-specific integrase [Arthrobacter roseus]MBM7847442.1 integrase [Arthrobacter roseus]